MDGLTGVERGRMWRAQRAFGCKAYLAYNYIIITYILIYSIIFLSFLSFIAYLSSTYIYICTWYI